LLTQVLLTIFAITLRSLQISAKLLPIVVLRLELVLLKS
jgi:hypothetical protein